MRNKEYKNKLQELSKHFNTNTSIIFDEWKKEIMKKKALRGIDKRYR